MKKIVTSLFLSVLLLVSPAIFSQNPHPFELGFNFGAAWLKSDVKMKKLGSGAGATFGQTYCMNQTSPLLWGWRFRYLNATTYGQDTKRSAGIANNEALNGGDTLLDYFHNVGYVYHNYQTHIEEVSFELLIGANKLRERTNLYPYIFGGAGITKATAKINQLDKDSKRYNFQKLDSTGVTLNNLYDDTYETFADGNSQPKWKFMPSVGVGLGYEIIKGFSIGLEHKVTWALNDILDGQRWTETNKPTGNNDLYHYSSFFIKFSFGRGKRSSAKNTTATTTIPGPTDYVGNTAPLPSIVFTNPNSNPANVKQKSQNVSAIINNINSGNDIKATVNGTEISGFTYNTVSHVFNYPINLEAGANTINITATNAAGSSNSSTTIFYDPAVVTSPGGPVVKIISPVQDPFTTSKNIITVSGTVQNISAKGQMKVVMNGVETKNFSYNTSSHAFEINSNLISGSNSFTISAFNSAGNDSKTTTVIYTQEQVRKPDAPVVSFLNPATNPFQTSESISSVVVSVLNISSTSQTSVTFNGSQIAANTLTFDAVSHQLKFKVNLVPGSNSIMVSATNNGGSDSKTQIINRTIPSEGNVTPGAPVVNISEPFKNPSNTTIGVATIKGSVLNIVSVSQLSVVLNGNALPMASLNFNTLTHQLSFPVNLIQGLNTVVIKATNSNGSDTKTEKINYTAPQLPVITFVNPATGTGTSKTSVYEIIATTKNVVSSNQIVVKVNGVAVTNFLFQPQTQKITFNANLIEGNNIIIITATTADGTDTRSASVKYVKLINTTIKPIDIDTATSKPLQGTGDRPKPTNDAPISGVTGGKSTPMKGPVIILVDPSTNSISTSEQFYTVIATVLNVNEAGISVKVNGAAFIKYVYDAVSKKLTIPFTLNKGKNIVEITATSPVGTKTETVIIKME